MQQQHQGSPLGPPNADGPPKDAPVGKTAVIVWNVLGVLATLVGGAVVGIAAYDSESAGMTASYVVAGPVGFFWGAGLGALIGRFAMKDKPGPGKIAPYGCGCGCAVFLGVGLVFFMVAIFPSL